MPSCGANGVTEGGLKVMEATLGERSFLGQDNAFMYVKGVAEGGPEVLGESLGGRSFLGQDNAFIG